jgi:hypothetical protein
MVIVGLGALRAPAVGRAAEGEAPPTVAVGEEVVGLNFAVTPTRLPPDARAPATLGLGVEVGPVAGLRGGLSTMTFDLDRSIGFEPRGPAGLQLATGPTPSPGGTPRPRRMPSAVVGHGEATIESAFPETRPKVSAPLKIYNGGALKLLIEMSAARPRPSRGLRHREVPAWQARRGAADGPHRRHRGGG